MKLFDVTSDNVDALADVMAELHKRAFPSASPTGNESWSGASILTSLSNAGVFALLALDESSNDVPIGFVIARVVKGAGERPGEGEIITIAVDPAHHRNGYGRGLIDGVIHRAKAINVEKLFLEVAVDNDGAIGLYSASGFKQVGLRKDYYVRDTEVKDALVMEKNI